MSERLARATEIIKMKITIKTNIIYVVLAALALACFALPIKTRADCGVTGDVPFTVTEGLGPFGRVCLYVKGPWGRISNGVRLDRGLKQFEPCSFYAAESNGFSPYGSWSVILTADTLYRDFCLPYAVSVRDLQRHEFSVNGREGASIGIAGGSGRYDITVSGGGSGSQNTAKVEAFLGRVQNNASEGPGTAPPDSNVFAFHGNASDSVTVRLEADGVSGNNGGQATLRFVGPPAKQVTGTLPLEFHVGLGSTARYNIAIEQPVVQGAERYRGGYILTVKSSLGNIEKLVPTDSVDF